MSKTIKFEEMCETCPSETQIRKRKNSSQINTNNCSSSLDCNEKSINIIEIATGSFWLTRIVLLRGLCFIYVCPVMTVTTFIFAIYWDGKDMVVAFLGALLQNKQLIGSNGLLPASLYLINLKASVQNNRWGMFENAPTIFWLFDYEKHCDFLLDAVSWGGLILSSFVLFTGCANVLIMFTLWVLYHSLVNIGQNWYSFGWESQLLESGFLAIFFCPLFRLEKISENSPPSIVVVMAYRWLIFRIMLGAGLIKFRGDACWIDLTCMNYHYETQPVPNPISYWMHQEPQVMHKFEVISNHVIELVLPWLLLMPQPFVAFGGAAQIFFQVVLIIGGNLSFLNWLTIIPSLCCFDDRFYSRFFSNALRRRVIELQGKAGRISANGWLYSAWMSCTLRNAVNVCLAVLIGSLSIDVVKNLNSEEQKMNTHFDVLRIVNSYGAFGSITKERTELVFEGTSATDPSLRDTKWLEYEFKCKPGSVNRRPCIISPYHYRLDWLMWFAAFQDYKQNQWLIHLAAKFLINDPSATSLIAYNPFECSKPPVWIRVRHYKYNFALIGSDAAKRGDWWIREPMTDFVPIVNLKNLMIFINSYEWTLPNATIQNSWIKPDHCFK